MQKRVVVIGGGIIGLSAAYHLRRAGADVVLCERESIGAGSSSENAGLVVPSHFVPLAAPGVVRQGLRWMFNPDSPFFIKPRFDADLFRWIVRFWAAANETRMQRAMPFLRDAAQASLRLYGELAREGWDFGLSQRGLLMLFTTTAGERHAREEARLAKEIGVGVRLLDRGGIERLDPGVRYRAEGAAYYSGDAHLDTERFMTAFAERTQQIGVDVRNATPILGFDTKGSRIAAVRTPAGRIEGEEFVLAAGAWSSALVRELGCTLPLQPGKGYSVTLDAPPSSPSVPSILVEARVAVTPIGTRLRCAGTMELAGMDNSVNQRRVRAILQAIPDYYSGLALPDADRARPWHGFRPCTPDGLPYIGRFRAYPNLIAATGHAMIGMTLGPITGRIVADIVADRPPLFELPLLSPDRYG